MADTDLDVLRAGTAELAQELVTLDGDPARRQLENAPLSGATAARAADVSVRLADLWQVYADLAETAGVTGARRRTYALGDSQERLDAARGAVSAVAAEIAAVGAAWTRLTADVEHLTAELAQATGPAERLGVASDPTVPAARDAVRALAGAVAADPLAVTPDDVERATAAVATAQAVVAGLVRAHDALDDDLRAAGAQLAEITALAAAAERSARESNARVAGATGLLALPAGWRDDPRRGLAPWLERLRALAAAGDWRTAGRGLVEWRRIAAATADQARLTAAANAAPLARLTELRGLLGALRAKAAGRGTIETAAVGAAYRRASDTLNAAPADLDLAERLVTSYRAELGASDAQGRPDRVEGT